MTDEVKDLSLRLVWARGFTHGASGTATNKAQSDNPILPADFVKMQILIQEMAWQVRGAKISSKHSDNGPTLNSKPLLQVKKHQSHSGTNTFLRQLNIGVFT